MNLSAVRPAKPLATLACLVLCSLCASSEAPAQTTSKAPLSDYVGTYSYETGTTVEIVAGDTLYAVLDAAAYQLAAAGRDEFVNVVGKKIPFRRDAFGKVTGFVESGTFYPRISLTVTPESSALVSPRPQGQDTPQSYRYRPPADLHDGITVGDIAQSELGAETANAIVRSILDGTYKNVHSVLLYQHRRLVFEEYFYGYSAERTHQLRSATKSIVSALAGIAIDQGAIAGVNEPVLPHMSYTQYEHPDPRKASMTLGNFLSMSSGLDCDDHSVSSPGREMLLYDKPDWVKATLDLPLTDEPGRRGFYCSGGVTVVGRMTENAAQMTLPEFAQKNLFAPLGIPRSNWEWNYNLTNQNKEYAQIHMRPRDMLKFGMLYADNGRWHGRQVISVSWVHASLAEHSHVDGTSYGYFFWRPWLNVNTSSGSHRVDLVAVQGNGGQKIYLLPQYDLVAVFTGGDYNSDAAPPNKIMMRIVLPALLSAQDRNVSPTKAH